MVSRWTKVVEVVIVCNVTVTVGFVMMFLMNDCKPITPNDRNEYPIQVILLILLNYQPLQLFDSCYSLF